MRWLHSCFIYLLLFIVLTDAISFNRTFKLKRQKKPSKKGRVKNALKKFMNISAVPTLPPIPTIAPRKVIVKKQDEEYDPCKVVDLCSNNGKCKSNAAEYYCECGAEYYGKTCQFFADPSYCGNQQCQNNGTCYSIDEPQIVTNPKLFDPNHDPSILKELTVKIQYQCWCKPNFFGSFCEFSEAMRHCAEETCSGHGIIKMTTGNFECQCHCEEHYSGNQCETVSPCRDLECTNQGKCIPTSEGAPKCECPSKDAIQFIEAEIKGDFCEEIDIDNAKITSTSCVPCLDATDASNGLSCSKNFHEWIECLNEHDITKDELSFLWKSCKEHDEECYDKLEGKFCFNNGNHSVVLDEFPIERYKDKFFVAPKCYCDEGFEGEFCQTSKNRNLAPCEEALESGNFICNGTCLYSQTYGIQCSCGHGMKGESCDIHDPCVGNPCENADTLCVEIPDGTKTPRHACICGLNQDVDPEKMNCITPHHEICTTAKGEPTCKNGGHCYPCALDENEKLSLCSDDEESRGFRCICPPGFMPPFCGHTVDACSFHKCQNGGDCIPKNGTLADYDCKCKLDYKGIFCEQAPDICKAEGFAACVQGTCEENSEAGRGFVCKCQDEYEGYNCHLKKSWDFFEEIDKQYWWAYPLLLSIFMLPFTLGILLMQGKIHLPFSLNPKKWFQKGDGDEDLEASKDDAEGEGAETENVAPTIITNIEQKPGPLMNMTPMMNPVIQSGESGTDDANKNKIIPVQESMESGKKAGGISEETQKKAQPNNIVAPPPPTPTPLPDQSKTPEKPKKKNKLRKK